MLPIGDIEAQIDLYNNENIKINWNDLINGRVSSKLHIL